MIDDLVDDPTDALAGTSEGDAPLSDDLTTSPIDRQAAAEQRAQDRFTQQQADRQARLAQQAQNQDYRNQQQAAQSQKVQRVKASQFFAQRQIPSYTTDSGDVQSIADETGAPLTNYDKSNRIAYDSQGNPRAIGFDFDGPKLSDPYANAPTDTDDQGNIYQTPRGLPWKATGQVDQATVQQNQDQAQSDLLKRVKTQQQLAKAKAAGLNVPGLDDAGSTPTVPGLDSASDSTTGTNITQPAPVPVGGVSDLVNRVALTAAHGFDKAIEGLSRFAGLTGFADYLKDRTAKQEQALAGQVVDAGGAAPETFVNPNANGVSKTIGSVAGGLIGSAPGIVAGGIPGLIALGTQAMAGASAEAHDQAKAQGASDEDATHAAGLAALKTLPSTLAFAGAGAATGKALRNLLPLSTTPFARAAAALAAGTAANVAAGSLGKAVIGENAAPTGEDVANSIIFAAHGAMTEHQIGQNIIAAKAALDGSHPDMAIINGIAENKDGKFPPEVASQAAQAGNAIRAQAAKFIETSTGQTAPEGSTASSHVFEKPVSGRDVTPSAEPQGSSPQESTAEPLAVPAEGATATDESRPAQPGPSSPIVSGSSDAPNQSGDIQSSTPGAPASSGKVSREYSQPNSPSQTGAAQESVVQSSPTPTSPAPEPQAVAPEIELAARQKELAAMDPRDPMRNLIQGRINELQAMGAGSGQNGPTTGGAIAVDQSPESFAREQPPQSQSSPADSNSQTATANESRNPSAAGRGAQTELAPQESGRSSLQPATTEPETQASSLHIPGHEPTIPGFDQSPALAENHSPSVETLEGNADKASGDSLTTEPKELTDKTGTSAGMEPHPTRPIIEAAVKDHADQLKTLGAPVAIGKTKTASGLQTSFDRSATGKFDPNSLKITIDPDQVAKATAKMTPEKREQFIHRSVNEEVMHVATVKYASESKENEKKLLSLADDDDLMKRGAEAYGDEWEKQPNESDYGLKFRRAAEIARMLLQGDQKLTEASYKFLQDFLKWLGTKLKNLTAQQREVIKGIKEKLGVFEKEQEPPKATTELLREKRIEQARYKQLLDCLSKAI